ncbi:MAG: DUF3990 domain-containing protein [Odoribacter splanchnicus]
MDFDVIDLNKSQRGKDFGRGFYLSEDAEQAYKLAVFKSLQFGGEPNVLTYDFKESLLVEGVLNFLSFNEYSAEWAEFVLKNRQNKSEFNKHSYDVVYGPIANDKVGVQIRLLLEHNISPEIFLERLKYMKGITFQYLFGTELAIKHLIRL